jgi:hypothetical protein
MEINTDYGTQQVRNASEARKIAAELEQQTFVLIHTNLRGKEVLTHVRRAGIGWEFCGGNGEWKPFTVK